MAETMLRWLRGFRLNRMTIFHYPISPNKAESAFRPRGIWSEPVFLPKTGLYQFGFILHNDGNPNILIRWSRFIVMAGSMVTGQNGRIHHIVRYVKNRR
jgi:hypothetical protein